MKDLLYIRSLNSDYFSNYDLEKYTLIFTDNHITQYKYLKDLKKIDTEKYFFIITNKVCSMEEPQEFDDINPDAVDLLYDRTLCKRHYMNVEQIKEIKRSKNCFVGGHSHNHLNYNKISNNFILMKEIQMDITEMFQWFKINMKYKPTSFCFSYNFSNDFYKNLLEKYGISEFFTEE